MDVRQFILEPNDARRLASLCGRQDTHLRLIESRLPVTIRNRGNQFEIEGEGAPCRPTAQNHGFLGTADPEDERML